MTPGPFDHPRTRRASDLMRIADLLPNVITDMARRAEFGGEDADELGVGQLADADERADEGVEAARR